MRKLFAAGRRPFLADIRTVLSAQLLGKLVDLIAPSAYTSLDAERRQAFVTTLGGDWVKTGVGALREFITAGQRLPKKKHPLSTPMVSVIMAPVAIAPPALDSPLTASLLQDLMTLPSLPFSLPLPALTTLSRTLPLFQVLLPAATADPSLLDAGGLATELGKTHFLSNLATFGITGGMLQRQGAQGMRDWIAVVGTMFSTLGEGWGRWVATSGSEVEPMVVDDSDSDEEDENGKRVVRKPVREPLPSNVAARLHSFASPAHLGTLVAAAMQGDTKTLVDFSFFVLGLLNAFRGSARWEATLDAVMEGKRGARMTKLLWREGVRGKWGSGRKAWETFSSSECSSCTSTLADIRSEPRDADAALAHLLPLPALNARRRVLLQRHERTHARRGARPEHDLARPRVLGLHGGCFFRRQPEPRPRDGGGALPVYAGRHACRGEKVS